MGDVSQRLPRSFLWLCVRALQTLAGPGGLLEGRMMGLCMMTYRREAVAMAVLKKGVVVSSAGWIWDSCQILCTTKRQGPHTG